MYLAYQIMLLPKANLISADDTNKPHRPPSFWAGVVAQFINPKAWIVVSIYVASSETYLITLALFCTLFFIICFLSILGWAAMGATLAKRVGNVYYFSLTMAALLALSILTLLYHQLV